MPILPITVAISISRIAVLSTRSPSLALCWATDNCSTSKCVKNFWKRRTQKNIANTTVCRNLEAAVRHIAEIFTVWRRSQTQNDRNSHSEASRKSDKTPGTTRNPIVWDNYSRQINGNLWLQMNLVFLWSCANDCGVIVISRCANASVRVTTTAIIPPQSALQRRSWVGWPGVQCRSSSLSFPLLPSFPSLYPLPLLFPSLIPSPYHHLLTCPLPLEVGHGPYNPATRSGGAL